MSQFDVFLNKLLDNPSTDTVVKVQGVSKHIKGMARFATVNMGADEYIKVVFDDHSFLLILIGDQEVYYADSLIGHVREITDTMIGEEEVVTYKGKEYRLGNKNDYQFVIQKYVGDVGDVEGECRFSDYFPTTGPKAFLSLGWLSYTGERADIYCEIIDQSEIAI